MTNEVSIFSISSDLGITLVNTRLKRVDHFDQAVIEKLPANLYWVGTDALGLSPEALESYSMSTLYQPGLKLLTKDQVFSSVMIEERLSVFGIHQTEGWSIYSYRTMMAADRYEVRNRPLYLLRLVTNVLWSEFFRINKSITNQILCLPAALAQDSDIDVKTFVEIAIDFFSKQADPTQWITMLPAVIDILEGRDPQPGKLAVTEEPIEYVPTGQAQAKPTFLDLMQNRSGVTSINIADLPLVNNVAGMPQRISGLVPVDLRKMFPDDLVINSAGQVFVSSGIDLVALQEEVNSWDLPGFDGPGWFDAGRAYLAVRDHIGVDQNDINNLVEYAALQGWVKDKDYDPDQQVTYAVPIQLVDPLAVFFEEHIWFKLRESTELDHEVGDDHSAQYRYYYGLTKLGIDPASPEAVSVETALKLGNTCTTVESLPKYFPIHLGKMAALGKQVEESDQGKSHDFLGWWANIMEEPATSNNVQELMTEVAAVLKDKQLASEMFEAIKAVVETLTPATAQAYLRITLLGLTGEAPVQE